MNTYIFFSLLKTIVAEAIVLGAHLFFLQTIVEQIRRAKATAGPQLFSPVFSHLIGPVGLLVSLIFFAIVFFQPDKPSQLFKCLDAFDACLFMCLCFGLCAAIADHYCGPTKKQLEDRVSRGSSWIPR